MFGSSINVGFIICFPFVSPLKSRLIHYKTEHNFNFIRVAHHGELAYECANAYYKYGRALLYKAQEEADPLASMPKKETESDENSTKDGSMKNAEDSESPSASVTAEEAGSSNGQIAAADDGKYP